MQHSLEVRKIRDLPRFHSCEGGERFAAADANNPFGASMNARRITLL